MLAIELDRNEVEGLPQGLYQSGKDVTTFVSNCAFHPIQTASQMSQAIADLYQ
jgi:predicted heme/steroid binding protein